jgi:hypothetical protein
VHLLAFLYYNNPDLLKSDLDGAAALDRTLVAANSICFFAFSLMFAIEVIERRFNAATSDMVSKKMAQLIVSLQRDLRRQSVTFIRALRVFSSTASVLFDMHDAHEGARVVDAIHGTGVITCSNKQHVSVRYDGGQTIQYDSAAASAKLSVLADNKDKSHVSFSAFTRAAEEALDGNCSHGIVYSSEALEALFYILLLLDKDTDLQMPYLSPQLRDHISKQSSLSTRVVSAEFPACNFRACQLVCRAAEPVFTMSEHRKGWLPVHRFGNFWDWIYRLHTGT